MGKLTNLIGNNRRWAAQQLQKDPGFFSRLAQQQHPEYLWIGCSDSRVPANQIVDLDPGELFVHRNVANVVVYSDLNCLSVIEFAVRVLRVKHIIVCGHYGCGGVRSALFRPGDSYGLADNWLRHVREVAARHRQELEGLEDESLRLDRLAELNVLTQVHHVCSSAVVDYAWRQGHDLTIHGWIYGVADGLVNDLGAEVSSPENYQAFLRDFGVSHPPSPFSLDPI